MFAVRRVGRYVLSEGWHNIRWQLRSGEEGEEVGREANVSTESAEGTQLERKC